MAALAPITDDRLNMSLDDIIEKTGSNRRGRRSGGGGGGAVRNNRRAPRSTPYGNAGSAASASTSRAPQADKIVVSNLAKNVTDRDVLELFSHVGPVRSANLSYDAQGKSKGVATVVFNRREDAAAAVREYHNRTLDNRPMKIELVFRADALDLVNPGAGAAAANGGGRAGGRSNAPRRDGGGRAGGSRRGGPRTGGARSERRPPADAAELDREMEAYMNDETMQDAQPTNGLAGALGAPVQ